jgi:hypothetical protein
MVLWHASSWFSIPYLVLRCARMDDRMPFLHF